VPLPPFNEAGDLPPGIHQVSLSEAVGRFGVGTARRNILARRLERMYALAESTEHLSRFVIFGSFITDKPEPNDVDVFLLMEDTFDVSGLTGETRLLFEHAVAQDYFGGSVFWLRRLAVLDDEESAVNHWQIKRDGTTRGLVEIISE
jgi:hypothetical protein